jgi:hypothetical protein
MHTIENAAPAVPIGRRLRHVTAVNAVANWNALADKIGAELLLTLCESVASLSRPGLLELVKAYGDAKEQAGYWSARNQITDYPKQAHSLFAQIIELVEGAAHVAPR